MDCDHFFLNDPGVKSELSVTQTEKVVLVQTATLRKRVFKNYYSQNILLNAFKILFIYCIPQM